MFPLIPPAWSRTAEGIESSNSQWYRLHFSTITHRLLLLRQQAEIRDVSIGDSPGRFSGSLLWCFSCHHHHHQRHQRSCPLMRSQTHKHTHTRNSPDENLSDALAQVKTQSHKCACTRIKKIAPGNSDHERDAVCNCRGWLCHTAAWMLNWGKKRTQSSWHLHTGKPLSDVEKMIPLNLNC